MGLEQDWILRQTTIQSQGMGEYLLWGESTSWLRKRKIKIISKKNYPELKKLYNRFDISEDAEVCLAVGGDGTFSAIFANISILLLFPIQSNICLSCILYRCSGTFMSTPPVSILCVIP